MSRIEIQEIHESLVNGQRKQMVKQIEEYRLYDFWFDYSVYLDSLYLEVDAKCNYFVDATISYHRITNR